MAMSVAREQHRTPLHRRRGVEQVMHPNVLGAIIGGAGASAFVHVNRHLLPAPWAQVALAAWSAAVVLCAWAVLIRPRVLPDPGPPRPHAGRTYLLCIIAMIATMAGGSALLTSFGRQELQPAVVVTAVGLHFVPFASAFGARIFAILGGSIAIVGIVGIVLGLVYGATAVGVAAVVTGVVMLLLMAWDALQEPGK